VRAVGSHGFTSCTESPSTGANFVKLSCVMDSVISTLNFIHSSRLAESLHCLADAESESYDVSQLTPRDRVLN
jgi:hypothetical protein